MKLSVVVEGYFLDKGLRFSPNSMEKYRHFLKLFTEYVGDVELEDIEVTDIRQFLLHLRTHRRYSRRSTHDVWAVLSSFWSWAEMELETPHIIRGKIKAPEYTDAPIDPFTADEVKRLLRAVKTNASGARRGSQDRDRAIILILLDTGIRASELCGLRIRDYDNNRGRLHVRHGKRDKSRYTVVGHTARKALWRYLANRDDPGPDEPLFSTKNGGHMQRSSVYWMIRRMGERAGVPGTHPHRFRHTFAITFLRNGGSVYVLQELLGHSDLATVLVYVNLAERDIDGASKHSPADAWKL